MVAGDITTSVNKGRRANERSTYLDVYGMKPPTRKAWSSLVEGGEGSYLPNCQTNLVIAL